MLGLNYTVHVKVATVVVARDESYCFRGSARRLELKSRWLNGGIDAAAGGDAPELLIQPDPPQRASHQDRMLGLALSGIVGGRVNSGVGRFHVSRGECGGRS